jgi:hypothetical protein
MAELKKFSRIGTIGILTVVVIVLMVFILKVTTGNAASSNRWEYIIVDGKCGMQELDNNENARIMNVYGNDGWEYIQLIPGACKFVMKRPVR